MGSWFDCRHCEETTCESCSGCRMCENCRHLDCDEPNGDAFYCEHCDDNPYNDDKNK